MEYKFTQDWFSRHIAVWNSVLLPLKGMELNVLELGSFEGRSTVWLLENILINPKSRITCVDTWDGGTDLQELGINWKEIEDNFKYNTKPFKDRVDISKESTENFLKKKLSMGDKYDIIYVDASHFAPNTLVDGVLSHLLLKTGGIIIFDDYLWNNLISFPQTPKPAIDAFMDCFAQQYELLFIGYQVILKKVV